MIPENILRLLERVRPAADIAVLAFILYQAYVLIADTNAVQIIRAAVVVVLSYAVAVVLSLDTILWLFSLVAPGLVMAFAIVFQPELRKVFLKLGSPQWFTRGRRARHSYVDSVLIAAELLAGMRRGMLVVFVRRSKLDSFIGTGTALNADLSSGLLVTIFGYNTPLHDGAVFIQGTKVLAAGCFLPLSEQRDIRKTFGTRHRAALGLSEVSDAVVLVVSEETGAYSLAFDGELHYDLSLEQVTTMLEKQLNITNDLRVIEDTVDEHKTVSAENRS